MAIVRLAYLVALSTSCLSLSSSSCSRQQREAGSSSADVAVSSGATASVGDGSGGAPAASAQGGSTSAPKPQPGVLRPDFLSVVPDHFAFGYSYYWDTRNWPPMVQNDGVHWDYMYWYQLVQADDTVLTARLAAAARTGAMPILTHYQLLDRAKAAGYTGANEWDVVTQGVENAQVMRAYYDNISSLLQEIAEYPGYLIFQTEPDSTTWLRQYHTAGSNDASQGHVAVAESGHPDLQTLPNTVAGYVQAIVRLRDLYAPHNVYIGLCIFDNENGYNPQDSVTFLQSLGVRPDVLFTHHIVKFSTRDTGWWDAYSPSAQARFVTWLKTITEATGLRYMHWQTTIGPADYGLMPNYPEEERISDLVAAGSIANLIDIYKLAGPPHSQPWHGFATSPPQDHPAYNSLGKLEERLLRYQASPIAIAK